MIQKLLTTEQAASLLGLKPSTLETWRSRGGGPPFVRIGKRAARYSLEDLDAYIEARRATNTGQLRSSVTASEQPLPAFEGK